MQRLVLNDLTLLQHDTQDISYFQTSKRTKDNILKIRIQP